MRRSILLLSLFILYLSYYYAIAQDTTNTVVPAAAPLPEVHIEVEKFAHSVGTTGSLHGVEMRYSASHDKVMKKLNKVMKKVKKFLKNPPIPPPETLMEIESESMDGADRRRRKRRNHNKTVIVDGTGGDSFVPQANLTKFNKKPKIAKSGFVPDNIATFIEESETVDRKRRRRRNNNSSVIIDDTGSLAHTPRANTKKYNKKPKIEKKGFKQDSLAEIDSTIYMEAERRRRKRKNQNNTIIFDGTGGLSHTPQANLTKFNKKPTIVKAGFVPDVLAELYSNSNVERRRRKRKNKNHTLIIDGTGGDSHTPQANLTKFNIKPKIEKAGFKPDSLVELVSSSEKPKKNK